MSVINRLRQRRALATPAARSAQEADIPPPSLASGALSRMIARMDSSAEQSRDGSPKVHGSALSQEWCSRRHAIFFRHGDSLLTLKTPTPAERLVWAIGRAVEAHIRGQVITSFGRGNCFGVWSCQPECGQFVHRGYGDSGAETCQKCGGRKHYREITLEPQGTVFVAHSDLIYRTAEERMRVMEIKSIKLAHFEALQGPKPDHVMQASTNAALLRFLLPPDSRPVDDRVHIVYGAKDYPRPGVVPYKDYIVPVVPRAATEIAAVTQDLHEILSGNRGAPLPPRLSACQTPAAIRAKNCGACNLCFQLT